MTVRDDIIQRALALPAQDRAFVADLLEQSLIDGELDSADVTVAWNEEIFRRIEAYKRGEMEAIDPETALQRMAEALAQQRLQE